MSLLSKLAKGAGKLIGKVAPIASIIPGPVGVAGRILGGLGKVAGTAATIAGVAAVMKPTIRPGGPGGPISMGMGPSAIGLPVIGAAARVATRALPGVGAAVAGGARAALGAGRGLLRRFPRSAKILGQLGLFAAGGFVYDQAGNLVGRVAYRRMNPLNAKAAKRAARRIKATHRLCREIESCLPRRAAPRSCAPSFASGGRRRRKC